MRVFSKKYALLGIVSFQKAIQSESLSVSNGIDRRDVIGSIISSSTTLIVPSISNAAIPNQNLPKPGIQGNGGTYTRVEGAGGGFDLLTSKTTRGQDVIYPASMDGVWKCKRVVVSVEGDAGQAELAWRYLGGTGPFKSIESFDTKFVIPPDELNIQNLYEFEGSTYKGTILDRGFELESRNECNAQWDIQTSDFLSYSTKEESAIEVAVVQRKVETPSEKGFGFNELYRITSSAGGIFSGNRVDRAVRVQRRYRRALDGDGNRVVEGLEIMKTFRVLDGIAGTEMPTSTTKSQIKLTRV